MKQGILRSQKRFFGPFLLKQAFCATSQVRFIIVDRWMQPTSSAYPADSKTRQQDHNPFTVCKFNREQLRRNKFEQWQPHYLTGRSNLNRYVINGRKESIPLACIGGKDVSRRKLSSPHVYLLDDCNSSAFSQTSLFCLRISIWMMPFHCGHCCGVLLQITDDLSTTTITLADSTFSLFFATKPSRCEKMKFNHNL